MQKEAEKIGKIYCTVFLKKKTDLKLSFFGHNIGPSGCHIWFRCDTMTLVIFLKALKTTKNPALS